MTNSAAGKEKLHNQLRIVLAIAAVLVIALVVPPFISVSRYKKQITHLIARSLGRPVRLASVEVHLLPWPGFVLTDLSVAEDPAYGAEPVLHANKVTASLRLLSLWRGRIEIDRISVDEASLNLVHAAPGKWNLDPIFRTAAAETGAASPENGRAAGSAALRLPVLEATNSRINFKDGAEKLPFSLVAADLELWQASPGEWRIRLRGQPARTDVSLNQEETGVVRMEAGVHAAPALQQMPLHLYLNWRQAQLGQLARLIVGSDPGWRGDLTGELHVDGTADAAQIAMRLRASGVHRAEFAPATPLDFDANCGLVYHYRLRAVEHMACDSPLGNGRMRLTGQKPGGSLPAQFTLLLDRIPVAAGLDALRTLRNGFDPGLEAGGVVSGKLVYAAENSASVTPARPAGRAAELKHGPRPAADSQPLSGSLTIADFALTGGGINSPVKASSFTLAPSAASHASAAALTGVVAIPAGGDAPLDVNLRFSLAGYWVGVRGQAAMTRARELAHAAGIPQSEALTALAGDPLTVDLTAAGPWLPSQAMPLPALALEKAGSAGSAKPSAPASAPDEAAAPVTDMLTGTIVLRNANWKADYLANHVQIAAATLHLDGKSLRWDPVAFSYGPVKGTAVLDLPSGCPANVDAPRPCSVRFLVQLGALDAGTVQSALLGAQGSNSLLSDLINRLHPEASPPWPAMDGQVKVDSLLLGPVTLRDLSAAVRVLPAGVQIQSLDAALLGGRVQLAGSLDRPANEQGKPAYSFAGTFQKLNAASVGALLGLRWSGAPLNGDGKIELSGYTAGDFGASAGGTLHFACGRGMIAATASAPSKVAPLPPALSRFDSWTADAAIAGGAIAIGRNQVSAGARRQSIAARVTFGDPVSVSFGGAGQAPARR